MLVGFYKYLLFPLGLAGGCVPEAYGQTPQDSLYHIREVVVTGRVVRREVIPVQELSGERLQRLNSHNVADALRYFSGIQIKDYGGVGGLKTVNIRSMGTNHVGVFYDGIELGNAQNGTVDLGRFSLDNMDESERSQKRVYECLREVDKGLVEAAQSMGATNMQIITKVLLPEAMPGIVAGLTISIISLIGYSAMAGAVGGGGLGDLGIRYGYQRFMPEVMWPVVFVLIVLVQGLQSLGDYLVRRLSHK